MIGYYVHHQGSGHLHRAAALARVLPAPVTVLSSLPRPSGWDGGWVSLSSDQEGVDPVDVTAGGRLHWVPRGDPGLRDRMARISAWLAQAEPELLISDVSVEVALLARLHGVPVVSVVLPGERGDPAHRMGHAISETLVAFWPPEADAGRSEAGRSEVGRSDAMVTGLSDADRRRLHRLGGLSRYPVHEDTPAETATGAGTATGTATGAGGRVVVLSGRGGGGPTQSQVDRARRQAPAWEWQVLGGPAGWHPDPYPLLCAADVVITHAGQNALAEVAGARRPAVVIPQPRPHREQLTTAEVLASGSWPARVEPHFPDHGWADRLAAAAMLDGRRWRDWCDGRAAERFARLLAEAHGIGR